MLSHNSTSGANSLVVWFGEETQIGSGKIDYKFIKTVDINITKLAALRYSKYKNLITTGSWVYMNRGEVNYILKIHNLPIIGPPSCDTCKPYTNGYIPMMSFYTGCPDCNPDDKGRYTLFEIESKSS